MPSPPAMPSSLHEVRVWDAGLRAFHWLLVASVCTLIVTGEAGGEWMALHARAGAVVAGLLGFRLVWGALGSTHARFSDFFPTPGRLRAYLQGTWQGLGHNPLGACSVLALLVVLVLQIATGVFAKDDIAFTGPWNRLVGDALADRLTGVHDLLAKLLFALLGLHLAALAFYTFVWRVPIVAAMLHGRRRVPGGASGAAPPARYAWIVALAAAFLAARIALGPIGQGSTGSEALPGHRAAPAGARAW